MSPAFDWRHMVGTPERQRWQAMTREQQAEAIRRMASDGEGEQAIAARSGLSVEVIRRILAGHPAQESRQT